MVTPVCPRSGLTTPPCPPPPTASRRPVRRTTGSLRLPAVHPLDLLLRLRQAAQHRLLPAPDLLRLWEADLEVELHLCPADPGQATFHRLSFLRKYLCLFVNRLQCCSTAVLHSTAQTGEIILSFTTHFHALLSTIN